ncbi:ACP S-malonyltransferase [Massilia sp. BJB1822]|uniref:ACP S-malonyltransferase n=1 Tax=Massilia sp. BJB1822 TaxID=2744470 RepID=UPI00159498E2|nr:ACP S-malonyltransferase [Massilia sp. BJB1822]NVD98023.1 ACP S-malonyltransferase [Massilia sp. BJB1822]
MSKTVFMFSGQGSQYRQMGHELYRREPVFRDAMQRLDSLVRTRCGESVLAALYEDANGEQPLKRVRISHPAIFMVEYALARTLIAADVRPDLVLGSSLGSYAAAAIAGCVDAETALEAVIEKALMLERHCAPGCMVAVMGDPAAYLTPGLLDICELAARNFNGHSVLAMPLDQLARVENHLRQHGLAFQRLDVEFAFHSRWIDAARQPYLDYLQTLDFQPAAMPLACCASTSTLQVLPSDFFWTVARAPIRFHDTVQALESRGSYRYIDVGPAGTLATFLKYGLPAGSSSQIHTLMSPFGSDSGNLAAVTSECRQPAGKTEQHQPTKESRAMKAVIFPGQGAQFKGMGKDVFPLYPDLVRRASEILGYSLEELCLSDSQNQLSRTRYTQPALFVVNALNYYRHQAQHGGAAPDFFAGHSLGEYNALLAAGAFSFETGLRLVKKRGELMGAARDGAMAAVLGASASEVQAILDKHQLDQIDIANYNSPTQIVIAGSKDAIAAAEPIFASQNLRYVTLNVSAAFHSRYMQPAQAEFARFLSEFSFTAPTVPVIANASGRPYEADRIAETLAAQIAGPVRWVDSVRYLMGREVDEFQEIGAAVLSKMVLEIRSKETPIVDERPLASAAVATPAPQPVESSGVPGIQAARLGSALFRQRFGLQYAYMAGAMYRGVASAELVIRMGKAGFLSFFGAGGLPPARVEAGIQRIQSELKDGQPYGMNLLANYEYPADEEAVVELYLKYGVSNVEAAAFMQMTPALVRFRLSGLRTDARGAVVCDHRIVAKISRPEVAKAFMSPAPAAIVSKLLEQGKITPLQAELAQRVPVAHDICVEADSGGHTDGGIAAVMLPPMLRMRDELQASHRYAEPICMGLAGGIGGPEAAAAAFLLGADFIMTGSINQCTVEAGMSDNGKAMLQEIDIHDTEYAPAGDMFEIGAQVQVLKKSVFFPARANKLLSLYRHHNSLDEIPERTRRQLEGTYFKKTFEEIWSETAAWFKAQGKDHEVIKAEANPKHKMALVFRWYFAYCTRIAMEGRSEDQVNYQIQTGPALGSFNRWVKGTALESWRNRHVDEIAIKLLAATAEHLNRSYTRFLQA